MEDSVMKVKDNLYVISVEMPDKPGTEWSDEDVKNVAYQAAVSINKLFDELIDSRKES